MGNRIVFGRWEAVALLVNLVCTKIFLSFPRVAAELVGTASWMLVAYVSLLAFLLFFLITKIYRHFEGKDIIDISEMAGGSFGRISVGLILTASLLIYVSLVMREFAEDMKVIAFTVSPVSFVTMFFVVSMAIGAWFGIEAIVRFHAMAVPAILFGYLVIVIAVLPFTDFTNILPILGNGPKKIFIDCSSEIAVYSELLLLFLIAPFLRSDSNLKKVGYASIGLSAFLLTSGALAYIAAIPYPTALENFLPIYQMARLINYGRFFQRLEPLFLVVWVTAALLYLTSTFYFLLYVFRKTFGLKYHKPLIMPFAVIVFTLSLMPANVISTVELESFFYRNISWVVTFGLTLVLLLTAWAVKGRKRKKAVR